MRSTYRLVFTWEGCLSRRKVCPCAWIWTGPTWLERGWDLTSMLRITTKYLFCWCDVRPNIVLGDSNSLCCLLQGPWTDAVVAADLSRYDMWIGIAKLSSPSKLSGSISSGTSSIPVSYLCLECAVWKWGRCGGSRPAEIHDRYAKLPTAVWSWYQIFTCVSDVY